MTRPCSPSEVSPDPDRRDAWITGEPRWDLFYLLVFVAVVVIVLVSTPGSRLVALAALAAMIPWYLLVGRPLWTGGRAGTLRAVIYVIGLIVLFGVAQSQNPEVWFLAFAIAPQFFNFLPTGQAMALSVALNFLAAALLVYQQPTASAAAAAFGFAAAGGGFSLFYGTWVSRIIQQSRERAEMIEQLEATRAELAAAQHEAGRLAERQRLAADIHDTLAQGFTSIVMLIQAAQAELGGGAGRAGHHLDLAVGVARENLAEARALVAGLGTAELTGGTLPDALQRLAAGPGVQPSFELSGASRPLPTATEVVLLRVCQEALSNVRKHAAARTVAVRLGYQAAAVRLEVSDDGTGFDPAVSNGGYGLRGMRSRVAEAGGTLTVVSSPGAGTQVSAAVPT